MLHGVNIVCSARQESAGMTPASVDAQGDSVISMDFCYTSRPGTAEASDEADDSEKNKLVVLVLHDKRTKFVEALPVQQKGAQKWLHYMCGEICRFASMLGYKQVTLRSDNEPTLYKLQQMVFSEET